MESRKPSEKQSHWWLRHAAESHVKRWQQMHRRTSTMTMLDGGVLGDDADNVIETRQLSKSCDKIFNLLGISRSTEDLKIQGRYRDQNGVTLGRPSCRPHPHRSTDLKGARGLPLDCYQPFHPIVDEMAEISSATLVLVTWARRPSTAVGGWWWQC